MFTRRFRKLKRGVTTRDCAMMPSQRQATGWISTDKTFSSDARKKKKLKALTQTSMLGFLRVKSNGQRDNDASPASKKRLSDVHVDSINSTSKKRRKSDMVIGSTSQVPSELQNSNEYNSCSSWGRRARASTPILLPEDDPSDFVHGESTACSSASSSRTLTIDSPGFPSVARKLDEILSHGIDGADRSPDLFERAPLYANVVASQTVVASSQVEEMETLLSPSRDRRSPSPVEGTVPSSQSQYLLPYVASPIRPRRISNKIYVGDEIVPSSQSQADTNNKIYVSDEIVPSSQSQTHTQFNLSQVYGEKESMEGPAVHSHAREVFIYA